MEFCPVGLEEPQPDMVCPKCRVGIDAYPDEEDTIRAFCMSVDSKCLVRCRCGHTFYVVPNVEMRWYIVSNPPNCESEGE